MTDMHDMPHTSPLAAEYLISQAPNNGDGFGPYGEELMGQTDCPEGCYVEPDGICPHNWLSAGRTAGVI